MSESEMDYCGSKLSTFVQEKEQRVDGSYSDYPFLFKGYDEENTLVRSTLMVLVIGYPPRILSKQLRHLYTNNSSQKSKNSKLDPWFITGFSDAESCFYIEVSKDSKARFKYTPRLVFSINLHVKDIDLLLRLKSTWNVGIVSTINNVVTYKVRKFADLEVVVNHFELYPLISSKFYNYKLWLQAYNIMKIKNHLNLEGFNAIVTLKSLINNGLSQTLLFPHINLSLIDSKKEKLIVKIPHGNWVAGFISGDGSFYIKMTPYLDRFHIGCVFKSTLHIKDVLVLEALFSYLGSYFKKYPYSNYKNRINKGISIQPKSATLTISSMMDISNIIIPFFKKYPIEGVKKLDFLDFIRVSEIILAQNHATPEGLKEIKQINKNMNQRREII